MAGLWPVAAAIASAARFAVQLANHDIVATNINTVTNFARWRRTQGTNGGYVEIRW
jgi:hypothetical protein